MNQSAEINNLKSLFGLYAPCWQEWCQYPFSGFNEHDVYIIENLRAAGFVPESGNVQMFYFSNKAIKQTLFKLSSNLEHYKEWAVMRFWFVLIKRLDKKLLEFYLDKPFDELPLRHEEKDLLKKFGVCSINLLIQTYTDNDLKQPYFFGLVLRFYSFQLLLNHASKVQK